MVRKVGTNAELESIHRSGAGLVFNDYTSGPTAAENNRLHLANCVWVRRMLDGANLAAAPSVRKIFFDSFDEAATWLNAQRGPVGTGWKPCGRCSPGRE